MAKDVKMTEIDRVIKSGEFKKVYLFYGEETYLRRQYKEKFISSLFDDKEDMNLNYYEGKNLLVGQIIDQAETLPFFADKRLIVIENSGMFKSANDKMADYIKEIPDHLIILFVEEEVDKRNKLYKRVLEVGDSVLFETPGQEILIRWIGGRVKASGKNMERAALQLFLEKNDGNMEKMDTELEKLICYCLKKDVITKEDVNEICSGITTEHVFLMLEAIVVKDKKKAVALYMELLELKESPIGVLSRINWQFKLLWQVRQMEKEGLAVKRMAQQLKYRDFMIQKNLKLAKRFTPEQLFDNLEYCAYLEEESKSGRLSDQVIVELMIEHACA
ncbi:DNA polymerase III subunit delta [Eubacterium oxidoreducens]|uniref:DNA polymerase III subunit delta n=1 Tax=Eubacterium oxidoreducens TaxID=1732 RepID=A0A1G6B692_EUBOX|nr:DNA polymerase III subunit delta [Eubacterium oxidoreducens]SDB16176.1 DNA polymerase III, delta subunit [Eubacterium oxidoreducens]